MSPELFRQPRLSRSSRRENEKTYQAVLQLRRLGLTVYRAGPNHSAVNGRRIHNTRLRLEALIQHRASRNASAARLMQGTGVPATTLPGRS